MIWGKNKGVSVSHQCSYVIQQSFNNYLSDTLLRFRPTTQCDVRVTCSIPAFLRPTPFQLFCVPRLPCKTLVTISLDTVFCTIRVSRRTTVVTNVPRTTLYVPRTTLFVLLSLARRCLTMLHNNIAPRHSFLLCPSTHDCCNKCPTLYKTFLQSGLTMLYNNSASRHSFLQAICSSLYPPRFLEDITPNTLFWRKTEIFLAILPRTYHDPKTSYMSKEKLRTPILRTLL